MPTHAQVVALGGKLVALVAVTPAVTPGVFSAARIPAKRWPLTLELPVRSRGISGKEQQVTNPYRVYVVRGKR